MPKRNTQAANDQVKEERDELKLNVGEPTSAQAAAEADAPESDDAEEVKDMNAEDREAREKSGEETTDKEDKPSLEERVRQLEILAHLA